MKTYERHDLSARYPDLNGSAWEDFKENLKTVGLIGRRITLFEGKILDGWQLYRACQELNLKPEFDKLPKGVDPEAFVETANEHRRHESEKVCQERAAARRNRVAAARQAGESIRIIAEREDVSPATVHADIKKASTVQGRTVEPPGGKVTGKDGKKRESTQPKVLCPRCQRVGAVEGCAACLALKNPPKPTKPPKSGKAKFDDRLVTTLIGKMVKAIHQRRDAFGETKGFRDCYETLTAFNASFARWQKEKA